MEIINEVLKHRNYYGDECPLINHPSPLLGQGEPYVSFYYEQESQATARPDFSIVTPVHNQQGIIVDNVKAAIACMSTDCTFEYIMIFDGCVDDSELLCREYFGANAAKIKGLQRVVLVHQPTSVFETIADNIGFRLSRGRYIIEVQADMKVLSRDFNKLLCRPCEQVPDQTVCGVSGRCCHAWHNHANGVGRLGSDFCSPGNIPQDHYNKFFVANTCNRGPLLLDADKLRELGYLDEMNFYQENSDHDYFARAFVQKGWICGYTPIEVSSPIQHGSTRKPRDENNTRIMNMLAARSNGGFLHNTPSLTDVVNIAVYDLR